MKAESKISKRKRDLLIRQLNVAIEYWEVYQFLPFSGLCTYALNRTLPNSPLRKLIKNYDPVEKWWPSSNFWFCPFAREPRIKLLKQFLYIAENLKPNCP